MTFECRNHSQITNYETCSCKKYKINHIYHTKEQVPANVEAILGTYEKIESSEENVITTTTFKEKSKDMYLFRVHPKGRVWTISSGLTIEDHSLSLIHI